MTTNQIEYGKLVETRRSNQVREIETERHNRATEQLSFDQLAEQIRSNKAKEKINWAELSEKNRSNLVNEAIQTARLDEEKRSNLAREAETIRSNMAKETETHRSNLANEKEKVRSNMASESISRASLQEQIRSNMVREAETERANKQRENEENRHNLKSEELKSREVASQEILNYATTQLRIAEKNLKYAQKNEIEFNLRVNEYKDSWLYKTVQQLQGIADLRATWAKPFTDALKAIGDIIPF